MYIYIYIICCIVMYSQAIKTHTSGLKHGKHGKPVHDSIFL